MSTQLSALSPAPLWKHFEALNAVPRPSKKEERVIAFMMDFGKSLGLRTERDDAGNVLIFKPATAGMQDRETVVLQSHLDMVHQKNEGTEFDFDSDGIRMRVNGDWVEAEGTTLGADNGIGVATMMALLSSNDIEHPALEALFTIDEETGMTGAFELKGDWLSGKILLNLDTEDDRELTIGCAGGVDVTATGAYPTEAAPEGHVAYLLEVKGLSGGHSGMDIHRGLANANKVLTRILYRSHEHFGLRISSIEGGGLRNAIPREAKALLTLPTDSFRAFETQLHALEATLKQEFGTTDPKLTLLLRPASLPSTVMQEEVQDRLLAVLYACPNGIYRMSPDIDDLVQSSNNLARVRVDDGSIEIMCLTRSSLDSEKEDLAAALSACFSLADLTTVLSGSYPGWQPLPGSPIVATMAELYQELFNEKPLVMACHAGLECGILGGHYPELDMVSFGPNIRGAHSPDERVQISSVQKYWAFLLETLKRIPLKASA